MIPVLPDPPVPESPVPESLAEAGPGPGSSAADDDQLLVDGQEEVFARAEVEQGVIEHHSLEEGVQPTPVDPDEAMAENFRASFNPRP
jgi:hypothetical protein